MTTRDVLVAPGAPLPADPDTRVLYRYPNGEALVRTADAAAGEPSVQGLLLGPDLAVPLAAAARSLDALADDAEVMAYVEYVGPIARPWLTRLQSAGVTPLRYQPRNAYLCLGRVAALRALAADDVVLRVTPLAPSLKRQPDVGDAPSPVWIVALADVAERDALADALGALGGVTRDGAPEVVDRWVHLPALVTRDGVTALLAHPRVLGLEARVAPTSEDELANLIVCGQYDRDGRPFGSYLRWLDDHGVNGAGVAVGVVDAGVDTTHPAFAGRVRDLTDGALDWHGTFVAGHVAGSYLDERDASGFIYGVGVAPGAEILVQSNQKGAAALCRETVRGLGPGGARGAVQNNSWGTGLATDPARMSYGAVEAAYDSLVRNADPDGATPRPLTVCFSTGNSGAKGLTRPKAAKNVIVTGNSESCRADVGREESDDIAEVFTGAHASSWGNCGDGRVRPDLVAPGEWTASANYDSHAGDKEYVSPRITWGGGSSAASPKTAGACALLIQWWRQRHAEPSPAMLRALLVNGATPMNFRAPVPNRYEGWGRLNLANVLDPSAARVYVDQTELLTERGESRSWAVRVVDPRRPLKITLCWTDPPAAVGAGDSPEHSAIVNALVLRAFVGDVAYRGNVFANGWSVSGLVAGAQAEGGDNLQNIFLPAGVATGAVRVVVEARDIVADCLDPRSVAPQQDFALVIDNATLDAASAPAEVYVGVDPHATDAPTHDPDDHWAPGETNHDAAELGASAPPAADVAPAPADGDEDAWWDAGEDAAHTETTREPPASGPPALADRRFVEAVATGIDLLAAGARGHAVLGARVAPENGGGSVVTVGGESPVAAVREGLARAGVQSLSAHLGRLEEAWSAPAPRGATRTKQSAVFVVGRGTRVDRDDLARLRRVALFGGLYLVSQDAGVLRFLAQRIHMTRGVSLRLAEDGASLAALVRDTVAEASGAHRVVLTEGPVTTRGDRVGWAVGFSLVAADRTVALHVAHPPDRPPVVQVRRPSATAYEAIDLRAPGDDVAVRQGDGIVVVTFTARDASRWVGPWSVDISQATSGRPDAVPDARARVWAWGDLRLRVETRDAPQDVGAVRAESGARDVVTGRVVVEALDGAVLRSVVVASREGGNTPEATRAVTVAPTRGRLDRIDVGLAEGVGPEADRLPLFTTGMSLPVSTARTGSGARFTDLSLEVSGRDVDGRDFQRVVRAQSVVLEARSVWRARLAQSAERLVVLRDAAVAGLEYDAQSGEIAALRLAKGDRQRTVRVAAPALRQALAHVDPHAQRVLFHVRGDELLAAVVLLADASAPRPGARNVR